jgi:hypothetical protein
MAATAWLSIRKCHCSTAGRSRRASANRTNRSSREIYGEGIAEDQTRAGDRNEGVGEHVRVKFHLGEGLPVKLRTTDPHRMKNANKVMLGSSAGPSSEKSELCRKSRSGRFT